MSYYNSGGYVLDITWEVEGMPGLVGPFQTRQEAETWGRLNIPNGSWSVAPLSWPYARSRGERGA